MVIGNSSAGLFSKDSMEEWRRDYLWNRDIPLVYSSAVAHNWGEKNPAYPSQCTKTKRIEVNVVWDKSPGDRVETT